MKLNPKHALSQLKASLVRASVFDVLQVIIALLVFVFILLNVFPAIIRPISFKARTGFAGFLPFFILLLYASFRLPGSLGRFCSITLTYSSFALVLSGLWETGQSQSTVFNGIVPLYDAFNYYVDALHLMAGQVFSPFSARRPLFPGLFAVLLSITNRNLMIALAILTAITAGACYLAAQEIQRTHGAESAVFVLTVLFLYYRYNSGLVMSESLGVSLGALGFVFLWRGVSEFKQYLVWIGLFLISLALNARAGPFFVLPVLVLWGARMFRKGGNRFSWHFVMVGLAAVFFGFLLNWLVFRFTSPSSSVLFANFSNSLYGLANGGKSWSYVYDIHPELWKIPEPDHSLTIYRLAFEQMLENPIMTVRGALFNWQMFFFNSQYGAYSYMSRENTPVSPWVYWGLYLLCALGVYKWISKPSDPFSSLVMASVFGILISVPFLPPTDASHLRPYAAGIMVFALLPAMGLLFIVERLESKIKIFSKPDSSPPNNYVIIVLFSLVLTLFITVGPIIIKNIGHLPRVEPTSCKADTESFITWFEPGTYFNISPDEDASIQDGMPTFHWNVYKQNSHGLSDHNLIAWAVRLKPSVTIFDALNYRTLGGGMIVSPSKLLPEPGKLLEICGHWDTSPQLNEFNIFYAQSVNILSP